MRSQAMGWENGVRVPITDRRELPDPPRPERGALVMVRRLVGLMLADTNPALGVECMALVTGIGYEGASMAEIARRHGVTRAAVSKRCVDLCDDFGIPPVRAMRPEENRKRCREARVNTQTEPDDPSQDFFREANETREFPSPMRTFETREKLRAARAKALVKSQASGFRKRK